MIIATMGPPLSTVYSSVQSLSPKPLPISPKSLKHPFISASCFPVGFHLSIVLISSVFIFIFYLQPKHLLMMGCLLYVAFTLAMVGHSSGAWCVCKQGVSDTMLQRTLDYACGAGADCNPLKSTGVCFNPNNVRSHCNYAVNSYFQKKGQTPGSCDFSGTAMVSSSDPSYSGCAYPASASSTSSSTTPGMTTPVTTLPGTTGTPSTTTTTPVGGGGGGSSPFMSTPNGVLGPSGTGSNTDFSHGERLRIQQTWAFSFLILFGLLWVVV